MAKKQLSPERKAELSKEKIARWNESRFKYIDVIVSSGEIRQLFFERCKTLKLDPNQVALKAGIPYSTFTKNYIKNPEPVCTREFNQEAVIKMLSFVGIDIKVLIKVKPFSETYVRLIENGLIKPQNNE